MTCKDCIHFEVCPMADDTEYISEDVLKEDCHDFKNKADFVEVVRCRECGFYQNGEYKNFCRKTGFETNDDDFCSYGERR